MTSYAKLDDMYSTILIRENNSSAKEIAYAKGSENSIVKLNASLNPGGSYIRQILKDVILPQGYPKSVSEDYTEYQCWDTLQAFCSTITSTLATRAVLQGVGVGDEEASSISAAITWVMKDGVGMIARILFAWISGSRLDSECKKWRLFADILNDIAICVEIFLLPYFKDQALRVLCVSTSFKAIVGVAGGATRAAITQHQSIKNNMADVSAKDGSQETCVNLIASLVGIAFLSFCGNSSTLIWNTFLLLTGLHLFANYKAVKSLNINQFNFERLNYVIQQYIFHATIASPADANSHESVFPGIGLCSKSICGYHIQIGQSIDKLIKYGKMFPFELQFANHLYKKRNYMMILNHKMNTVYIFLDQNHTTQDVVEAYFHAIVQGIAASMILKNKTNAFKKLTVHKRSTLLEKLTEIVLTGLADVKDKTRLDADIIIQLDSIASKEECYLKALQDIGWNIEKSYLPVGDWRASWKETTKSAGDSHSKFL